MLLTSPLLGAIVSGGLFALAAPTQDELARRELALTVLARAQQEGGPALQFARQLLGGGSSFAPYTVACPSNVTWVRSATVSDAVTSASTPLIRRRACPVASRATSLSGSNTSKPL
jgi:hypothetical protein